MLYDESIDREQFIEILEINEILKDILKDLKLERLSGVPMHLHRYHTFESDIEFFNIDDEDNDERDRGKN
jgi:hypothetical protein